MLLRLRLLTGTVVGSLLLLLMLCLGSQNPVSVCPISSQNLNQRQEVNLGVGTTAELPTGFVVGIAVICGVLSGGSTAALLRR